MDETMARDDDFPLLEFRNTKYQLAYYTSRRTKQDTIRYSDWATITIDAAMTSSFLGFTGWDPDWAGLLLRPNRPYYTFCGPRLIHE
jgi:hypothetical protein